MKSLNIKHRSSPVYVVLFACFLMVFMATSCSTIYRPAVVATPNLNEKYQGNFSGYLGTGGSDVQAAFAPAENIGLMCNYSSVSRLDDSEMSFVRELKHSLFEIGGGYWEVLNESNNFLFDIYAGAGIGSGNYRGNEILIHRGSYDELTILKGNYHKYFIQPGISYFSENFEATFSMRFSHINYRQLDALRENITTNEREIHPDAGSIFPTSRMTLVDPTVTLKAGSKHVKLVVQVGLSWPTAPVVQSYNPFMMSVGITINLKRSFFNKSFEGNIPAREGYYSD